VSTNPKIVDLLRGVGPLTRPLYQQGLLLQDDDLTAAVEYTRNLNRLMFRSLFGCGVICGLVVEPVFDCCKLHVKVAKGVALDCRGDPIDVATPQDLAIDPLCLTDAKTMWVMVRAWSKACAPRTPVCPDEDEAAAICTRAREGFELKVITSKPPECACQCDSNPYQPPQPTVNIENFPKKKKPHKAVARNAKSPALSTGLEDAPADLPKCYQAHYDGDCNCDCCDSEWVVLAMITPPVDAASTHWKVDHSVRRFIRPALIADPQPAKDYLRDQAPGGTS